ncbi:MAG: hypothetical protein RLZZ292_2663 [Bacteroidota bacterium]|jgi:hypothetical protein
MKDNNNDTFDLDGLKQLWKADMETQSETQSLTHHQLLTIMLQKTTSAVQAVQRNLLIEILVTIPLFIGGYFTTAAIGRPFPISTWLALFVAACSYHVYLYWKLTKLPPNEAMLSITVEKQVQELKGLIKMYQYLAILVGLIFFFVGVSHVYFLIQNNILLLIPQVFFSLFSGLGAFFVTRWYIDKLYGQHYTTLLECCKTLQSA